MPKKTLNIAHQKDNIIILQVKKNHPTLHSEILATSLLDNALQESFNHEMNRGRDEIRNIKTFPFSTADWPEVKVGIKLFRHTIRKKGKKTIGSRNANYFICNQELPAQKLNDIIRKHWCIENSDHHVRDNVLMEDNNRIKIKAENMMIIRSFGFNIIQTNKGKNAFTSQIETNKMSFDKLLVAKGVVMK